jgi:hypothetical protein
MREHQISFSLCVVHPDYDHVDHGILTWAGRCILLFEAGALIVHVAG